MLRLFRYHIILIIALIIGSIVIYSLVNSYYDASNQQKTNQLNKVHNEAILKVETGINVYATVVSSIRSYIENSKEYPSEKQLQEFLFDLTKEINFKDSIVVSLIDTTHTFKYVITKNKIDPNNLKGINTGDLRPKSEIIKLNNMMHQDSILLFDPINLKEGWAAFPFNFSTKDKNGKLIGYVASVLNVKYLLNSFYNEEEDLFAHRFIVGDSIDLTRNAVFDGTKIYSSNIDNQYYKNFDLNENDFKYTKHNFFGLNIKIGTAYKIKPKTNNAIAILSYLWYALLLVFTIVSIIQFYRNYLLSSKLKLANDDIENKNIELEYSLSKIQTLIKEIHHRVKNNMQMVASLLLMQENEYEDEKIVAALVQSRNRIQSMSLVHEKLYGSENLEDVNISDYLKQLISFVEKTIGSNLIIPSKIIYIPKDLTFDGETTVSLGLIINELITNSYRYAFKENLENELIISITRNKKSFTLNYSDSGSGIPDHINIKKSKTLGLQLINILTEQLDGSLTYKKNDINEFIIEFKGGNSND